MRLIPQRSAGLSRSRSRSCCEADWIVLGPGSWFTSVIPHLLVPKLAEAIHATAARRILTLNLEPAGETAGFSAAKHIELLAEHAPDLRLDVVLADSGFASDDPHLAVLGRVARRTAGGGRPRRPGRLAPARPPAPGVGVRRDHGNLTRASTGQLIRAHRAQYQSGAVLSASGSVQSAQLGRRLWHHSEWP